MENRTFGKTGWTVSSIGFGAWAIGGSWGSVDDTQSKAALHATLDAGVTFLDTADVYGDGHSERLIAEVLAERGDQDRPIVASKAGRRLDPHIASAYTIDAIEGFLDRTLTNLRVERLDLLQLHCPPTPVYDDASMFEGLDGLIQAGKLHHYGVSVETIDEALTALDYPGLASVQIIYNAFRQRPAEELFIKAGAKNVAIIARVPLASGLLTGKLSAKSTFQADDHRAFNRHGEAFDVGETFSGVPYEAGLAAVDALRPLVPEAIPMAQWALRWILMEEAVTVAIPGARTPEQALSNAQAADLAPLSADVMAQVREVYDAHIAPHVHHRW
ncbi:MAG: aldo/keto reductase [Pseudomonadota bacterium]